MYTTRNLKYALCKRIAYSKKGGFASTCSRILQPFEGGALFGADPITIRLGTLKEGMV